VPSFMQFDGKPRTQISTELGSQSLPSTPINFGYLGRNPQMRRREDHPIQKHTLNLYAGDYEKLQTLYSSRVGAAKIIRDIIHAHIRRIEENAAQRLPAVTDPDLELY